MKYISAVLLPLLMVLVMGVNAQSPSLAKAEKELSSLAQEVLVHESLDHKIKQNKKFSRILIDVLKRPESFNYPFDSLQTISMLRAEDNSFRIFTWHIVDRKKAEIRGEHYHYYFGMVQRKYENPNGKTEYLVIPLLEIPRIPGGIENMQLDNQNWLGAQYYPMRNQKTIPKYTLKTKSTKARMDSIYVIGKGWNPKSTKARKQDLYVLLGWNGNDDQTNYKIAEVLSFDKNDPNKVIFGAGAFYFDQYTSKQRAVFKYSDNAPFSLNTSYVKVGNMGKKKQMIVYDHMGMPNMARATPKAIWDMGPDGSYDALHFSKRYGGFRWYRNVELADGINKKLAKESEENQEKILRARLKELKRIAQIIGDQDLITELEKLENKPKLTRRNLKYMQTREKQILKDQQRLSEQEKERLKKAGIDLDDDKDSN